jgi:hypothetical protein
MKKVLFLTLAVCMIFAQGAFAELNLSANVETNTTFEAKTSAANVDTTHFPNDGRVEVVLESKTENEDGMYFAGKGCFEVQVDGSMGVCDVWAALGNASMMLKVGHWEAEGLFSKGQDTYIADAGAASFYEANKVRGRDPDGIGVVMNMGENMTLDAKMAYDNSDGWNKVGARPMVILEAGSLHIEVGGEYLLETPEDSDSDDENTWAGGAVDLAFSLDTITIGGSVTYGKNETTTVTVDDTTGVETKTDTEETYLSGTGYTTIAMGDNSLGIGGGFTQQDEADTNQMYAFVSYALALPVEGAKVTFASSYSTGDAGTDDDPTAFGARVRFNYDF